MIKTKYIRLPNEYQEVEYIESSGSQYIDTGVVPTGLTKIDADINILSTNTTNQWKCIFGARDYPNGDWYTHRFLCLYFRFANNKLDLSHNYAEADIYTQTSVMTPDTRFNVVLDAGTAYINGNLISNMSTTTKTFNTSWHNLNIYLFNNHIWNNDVHKEVIQDRGQKVRIYKFKIYDDNGDLIRDYVPCYRKSDNEIGLYDTVTGTFFTNAGTGTFLKGSDVRQYTVKKITTKVNNTRLPNTYQEVKYIESTGGQYIDTGYTPVIGDSIEVRNINWINGAPYYAGTNDYQIGALALAYSASRFVSYFKYAARYAQEIPRLDNGPYKIKQKGNGEFFVNDKFASKNEPSSTGPNTQLFIGRRPNNENQYFVGYYGEVIVTNSSNVVVRDLIPCYRKSDNVIGMYDLANNVFYTNSGSGSFTKGPNISSQVDIKYIKTKHNNTIVEVFNDNFNNYQEVEYLNFNGHQAILALSTFTPTFGKFYMKIYQPQSSNQQYLIFGYATFNNGSGTPSKQNADLYTTGSNLYWRYRGNSIISNSINNSDILEITLDNTNKKMTINGTDYAFPSSYNNTCVYTREAFVVGGEVYEDRFMFTGRMYNFKYYDDGGNNLLVDLVPCYRKSDNKPGMYDKVHNTFYTNAGTGDFTVGPNV